ncbi:MAG: sulfatase [Bacteroidetes bacterium]|nr:MAG: sulfatase [Bacteroidota bacterium]
MRKLLALCSLIALIPLLTGFVKKQETPSTLTAGTSIAFKTKYHIILVLDGPRWSETFGDSSYQYIPNMGRILKKEGTLFTNFRNEGSTYTNSGHTALCTGVHQNIPNNGKKLPKNPSIFQYLIKQRKLDKRKAWILTSKGKLEMLANTKNKDWWNTYMPSTYCGHKGSGIGYPDDHVGWPIFKSIIQEHKPVLTLINLLNIDVWGHANNWEKYLTSIRDLDGMALDLWKMIQQDPEMKNQTALYITNDHGRHLDGHKDGFKSHGDGCEGCRHISLLALGPDIAKNKEVDRKYDQVDLTATIACMLGVEMSTGKGKAIPELMNR